MDAPVIINHNVLDNFGISLCSTFGEYERDRQPLEERWLRNLRQYKGQYDPEIEKLIPADRSKAYPKITRVKVQGTTSRLMEMLFPQTEKNWSVEPSPIPNLKQTDLQALLDEIVQRKGAEVSDDQVEKEILIFAKAKAEKMSKTIEDQLAEQEYVGLVKSVVQSGILYGVGRLRGPFIRREKVSRWRRNQITGKYETYTEERLKPFFEVGRVWDWYPDLSAKDFDQTDGFFEREIHSRAQVRALADRPDYLKDRVLKWLENHRTGNYKERSWETILRSKSSESSNTSNMNGRKYETYKWWGMVPGHVLEAAGVKMAGKDVNEMYEASVHLLGNTVIKCVLNPYGKSIRPEHIFVYGEDDTSLTGEGLPETMRDSQLGVAHAARMVLDNGSVVCGPNLLLRLGLLADGQDTDIHANKVWMEHPDALETNKKLIENVGIDSHIPELIQIIKLFMEFADTETALPPPALGDVSQGGSEALRTKGNASMFLGAAALPIRDVVRNFDKFTRSAIGALYDWNMEFNTDSSIKGDYNVVARGSTSLIAKEVRAQALDWLAQTLRPQEEVYVNDRKFLEARMKVRDLDIADVLEDEDEAKRKIDDRAAAAQQDAETQKQLVAAQVRDLLASAMKKVAEAREADVGTDVKALEAILGGLADAISADRAGNPGAGGGDSRGTA